MEKLVERYLIDADGNRISVIVPVDEYEQVLARLEELESIYAYDQAVSSENEAIPLEEAIAEIERR